MIGEIDGDGFTSAPPAHAHGHATSPDGFNFPTGGYRDASRDYCRDGSQRRRRQATDFAIIELAR